MTLDALHVHAGNLYGGVETILVTLARSAVAAPELRHRFALSFGGRLAEELRAAGTRVNLLGPARVSRPWTIARARRWLREVLDASPAGVAICHSAWSRAIFGPVLAERRVPSVLWLHGAAGPAWLERWARRAPVDLVIANSDYTARTATALPRGVPVERLLAPVAEPPHGEADDRAAVRRDLGAADGEVVIVQVSRMEPSKGHRVLLEALGRLRGRTDWKCWIVGGPQRPAEERYLSGLRAWASALGVAPRVTFLGSRDDVPALLAAADLFCHSNSLPEAFGIVFVEALYAGIPIVATRPGGSEEIVDDTCGVLVPSNDADALSRALVTLLEDPGRRRALGSCGPARARALCDPATQVRRLEALLRSVATGRRTA